MSGRKRSRSGYSDYKKVDFDKRIVSVQKTGIGSTQVSTLLDTSSEAQSLVGLRWNLSFSQDAGTGISTGMWAIVVVPKGNNNDMPNDMDLGDGNSLYDPASNLMTFGSWSISDSNVSYNYDGAVKTSRILKEGYTLHFIAKGVATNTVSVQGTIQWFYKD